MKKLLFSAIAIACVSIVASAQDVTLGVRGGVNFSNLSVSNGGGVAYDSRVGFNVGLSADKSLSNSFAIQSGLYFSTRGAVWEEAYEDDYDKATITLNYIQIPLLASYRYALGGGDTTLSIDAGPYVGYGISGKIKSESEYDNEYYEGKVNAFDKDGGGMKKLDYGLRVGAGFYFGQYYAGVSYDLGLANLADKKYHGRVELKNTNFSINVGMNF